MTEDSRDYHDYVFRDGKLVGEFEAMYRNSEGTPWHQNEQENWVDVRLTREMLGNVGPFSDIHDLGCGLGHYLAIMRDMAGSDACRCFGYDISETACEKAKKTWPRFTFAQFDLTSPVPSALKASAAGAPGAKRLFIIRGTLWYVFPKLDVVIGTIRDLMGDEDQLLVVQNFPPLDSAFIGKDVIPDHQSLINHFSPAFLLTRHIWYEDTLKSANDNWFIGLFSSKDR